MRNEPSRRSVANNPGDPLALKTLTTHANLKLSHSESHADTHHVATSEIRTDTNTHSDTHTHTQTDSAIGNELTQFDCSTFSGVSQSVSVHVYVQVICMHMSMLTTMPRAYKAYVHANCNAMRTVGVHVRTAC